MTDIGSSMVKIPRGTRVKVVKPWTHKGELGTVLDDIYSTTSPVEIRLDTGDKVILRAYCLEPLDA